ncbi:MAG: hypothetical protein HYR97_05740 [Candidatus Melainabacteria bacterium]|nr:hypothetical protein [Candidatus Melainabacteria bacterium]
MVTMKARLKNYKDLFNDFWNSYSIEIIFTAAILIVYFFWFYSKWNLGIDQGIHLYTAWGILNGMTPYVDIINIQLPGLLLINIIARLLGGADPIGLRMIDSLYLFILCISTAVILSRWKVGLPIRIISITLYLVSYFATGTAETAQKESFALPLTILGLLPWLSIDHKKHSNTHMLVFGIITGLGIWVKITPAFLVVSTLLISYLFSLNHRKEYLSNLTNYLAGIGLVSISFLSWLVIMGSLKGFFEWCVYYGTGPYLETRWEIGSLIKEFGKKLLLSDRKWPLVFCVLGFITVFITNNSQLIKQRKKELIYSTSLVLFSVISIYVQGKSLQYHFIPLQWSLAVFGGVLFSISNLNIFPTLLKIRFLPIIFCIIALLFSGHGFSKTFVDTDLKLKFIKKIKQRLKVNETIVLFGNAAYIYSYLERKTPFPFIASIGLHNMVPLDSPIRNRIINSLVSSLKDPSVKLFIVQDRYTLPFHGTSENAKNIVQEQIGNKTLQQLGYTKKFNYSGFEIYIKEF